MSGLRLSTLFTTLLKPWEERHHGKKGIMESKWAVTSGKGHIFLSPKPHPDFSWASFQALIALGPANTTWWVFTGEGLCLIRMEGCRL